MIVIGSDGRARCPWGSVEGDYVAYHDEEWGRPVHDSRALFEKMCLEAFQSGLAWITILRKRPAFRAAFANFEIERVAAFGEDDVARLMADAGIVRNRAKIEATLSNARATVTLRDDGEPLDELVRAHAPAPPRTAPKDWTDVPPTTVESVALARELRRRGFRFVGPTTLYALMQACGLVDDHIEGCLVRVSPGSASS